MTSNQFYILVATICFTALAGYFFVFRVFMRIASFFAKAVLVGILITASVLFVPGYIKNSAGGKTYEACRLNSIAICESLEKYAEDNDGIYPSAISELVPGYIDNIPECPEAELDTYSHTYTVSEDRCSYSFRCSIKHHQKEDFAGKH
jgi:hypothetical protein